MPRQVARGTQPRVRRVDRSREDQGAGPAAAREVGAARRVAARQGPDAGEAGAAVPDLTERAVPEAARDVSWTQEGARADVAAQGDRRDQVPGAAAEVHVGDRA